MMTRIPKELSDALEAAIRDAYRTGWDDATAALIKAASDKRPDGSAVHIAQKPSAKHTLSKVDSRVTAREAVLKALQAKPGMQAREIFEWAQAKEIRVTFDAVRTAIKRLGQKGTVGPLGVGYGLKTPAGPKASGANGIIHRPTGEAWSAALTAMRAKGGKFTTDQILEHVITKGWALMPRHAARGRLAELVAKGTLRRVRNGVFEFPPTPQKPGEFEIPPGRA